MIGLAYSSENPILDSTLHPGRGVVTKAVIDDPVYGVVTDLLFRKRVVQDDVDVDKLAAKFSMSVAEAAAELGIHESAVRQAIAAKRLPSWLKEGRHYVDPRALKTLEVGTRRPTKKDATAGAPLEVRMGSKAGASFSVRAKGVIAIDEQTGHVNHGAISRWHQVVVRSTGKGGSKRAWVIVTRTRSRSASSSSAGGSPSPRSRTTRRRPRSCGSRQSRREEDP